LAAARWVFLVGHEEVELDDVFGSAAGRFDYGQKIFQLGVFAPLRENSWLQI
jgi:hypothetical protein